MQRQTAYQTQGLVVTSLRHREEPGSRMPKTKHSWAVAKVRNAMVVATASGLSSQKCATIRAVTTLPAIVVPTAKTLRQ